MTYMTADEATAPPTQLTAGRSMYDTARLALANYDDATAEGRDTDRVLYAFRLVAVVRAICDAIDAAGGFAVLVTEPEPRLAGTFGTEQDARQWAADHLTGASYTVMPCDLKAVARYIEVPW